jgi:hypothetical protein
MTLEGEIFSVENCFWSNLPLSLGKGFILLLFLTFLGEFMVCRILSGQTPSLTWSSSKSSSAGFSFLLT